MNKTEKVYVESLLFINSRINQFYSDDKKSEAVSFGCFKKAWIFKEKCAVIDFSYDGVNFAFNLFPVECGKVRVDLLQRKGDSNFVLPGSSQGHVSILNKSDILDALKVIDSKCQEIVNSIFSKESYKVKGGAEERSKRVGILTLPLNKNYGGNLQAYALLKVITFLGHKAIFINRRLPAPANLKQEKSKALLYSNTVGLSKKPDNRKFIDDNFPKITRVFFSSNDLIPPHSREL